MFNIAFDKVRFVTCMERRQKKMQFQFPNYNIQIQILPYNLVSWVMQIEKILYHGAENDAKPKV